MSHSAFRLVVAIALAGVILVASTFHAALVGHSATDAALGVPAVAHVHTVLATSDAVHQTPAARPPVVVPHPASWMQDPASIRSRMAAASSGAGGDVSSVSSPLRI